MIALGSVSENNRNIAKQGTPNGAMRNFIIRFDIKNAQKGKRNVVLRLFGKHVDKRVLLLSTSTLICCSAIFDHYTTVRLRKILRTK